MFRFLYGGFCTIQAEFLLEPSLLNNRMCIHSASTCVKFRLLALLGAGTVCSLRTINPLRSINQQWIVNKNSHKPVGNASSTNPLPGPGLSHQNRCWIIVSITYTISPFHHFIIQRILFIIFISTFHHFIIQQHFHFIISSFFEIKRDH